MYTSGYARTIPFSLHICEYWRADKLEYGFIAGTVQNNSAKTVDLLVVGVAPSSFEGRGEGYYMPVWTVDQEDLRRLWYYNVPTRSWSLTYESTEHPGSFTVETEAVKDAVNKTNETEEGPSSVSEEVS